MHGAYVKSHWYGKYFNILTGACCKMPPPPPQKMVDTAGVISQMAVIIHLVHVTHA